MNVSRIVRIGNCIIAGKSHGRMGKAVQYAKNSVQPVIDIKNAYQTTAKAQGRLKGGVAALKKTGLFGTLCSSSMGIAGAFFPCPGTGFITAGIGLKIGSKLDKLLIPYLKSFKNILTNLVM